MKFDVIVGNPPYTHLRNMNNRRYAAYPKQRDMAQVFVRWAMDHLTENGVCSYNIIDTWLNVKLSDGAKETRTLLSGKFREVLANEAIARYSWDEGGDIITCIVCFSTDYEEWKFNHNCIPCNYDLNFLTKPGFLYRLKSELLKYEFKNISISRYVINESTVRTSRKFVYHNYKLYYEYNKDDDFYLLSKRSPYGPTYIGNWKLIKGSNIKHELQNDQKVVSYNFVIHVSYKHGLWLLGYLNTHTSKHYFPNYFKHAGRPSNEWCVSVTHGTLDILQVPDFDWYKTNKPQQHAAFLKWVEDNMRDKDAFLAGIDKEFEKLIKE